MTEISIFWKLGIGGHCVSVSSQQMAVGPHDYGVLGEFSHIRAEAALFPRKSVLIRLTSSKHS